MQGYPKTLQTREDYDYVLANFTKEQYVQDFKDLLDSRFDYVFDHKLAEDEVIPEETPHKVMVNYNQETKENERLLYNKIEIPDAKIFRLGFTVAEVEAIINN